MTFINNRTMHDRRHTFGPGPVTVAASLMAQMTMGQVEASTGGVLVSGSRSAVVTSVSIDSRTIRPGDLFIAIRGPRTDGHRFVPEALRKGACGAVIDLNYELPATVGESIFLRVADTHRALKDLAADARRQWRGSLVAITGSVGKTMTKEYAAHILQTEYSVYRSPGNYNNLFGLPLSLFGLRQDDHIGVFEMGMSAPGEIGEMCRIARPDVGIITNVAPVHLQFFKSVEEIAEAKGELARGLESTGTLIYNMDDPLVKRIADPFNGHKFSFGLSKDADVRAAEIEILSLEETRFQIYCSGLTQKATIPMAGLHYVLNVLPGIALGRHYRIPPEQIIESLRDLPYAPMRGQILRFKGGFTVIDDTYNSNPRALMQMTDTLTKLPSFRRRILIAGEMLELGTTSPSLHYECGAWAARCGVDIVVAVHGDASHIARGAMAGGLPETRVHFFNDVDRAALFVSGIVVAGDLLLVKGSRGVHLEKLVQALRSEHVEESR